MYIERVFKLKLKPDEAEILDKCNALLEDILHDFNGECLGDDVEIDDIAFASDVLLRLNTDKELY